MKKPKSTPTPTANETLLSASAVYLFGRSMSDIRLVTPNDPQDPLRPPRPGNNNFLKNQLRDGAAGLARIYYFSYQGGLFELANPAMFLVHGNGTPVELLPRDNPAIQNASKWAENVTITGLGRQIGSFASDLLVWVYDKGDYSMRLDMDSGTLEQILLASESANVSSGWGAGAMARSSGSLARSSGALARSSGAMSRRSGEID